MRLRDVLGSGKDHAQADAAPVTEPAEPTTPGAPEAVASRARFDAYSAAEPRGRAPVRRVTASSGTTATASPPGCCTSCWWVLWSVGPLRRCG